MNFTAQYGSTYSNHSLDIAYNYALKNPSNPEGPLPQAAFDVAAAPIDVQSSTRGWYG